MSDLKHTFGHRLRSVAVSFEDRQVLLGYKTQSVTIHYSAAELGNLIYAANKGGEVEKHLRILTKNSLEVSRAIKFKGGESKVKLSISL